MSKEMTRELVVPLGVNKIAPGLNITTEKIVPIEIAQEPGETAEHESEHAVPAIVRGVGVIDATCIKGLGYEGRTRIGSYDAVSFLGPHSRRRRGTGYDVAVVKYFGDDMGSAEGAARDILDKMGPETKAAASIIEYKGTATGADIEWAMDQAANPEVKVKIDTLLGEERVFVKKTKKADQCNIRLLVTEYLAEDTKRDNNANNDLETEKSNVTPFSDKIQREIKFAA